MLMSRLFAPTRKEDPADAEIASHKLLIRAGFIRMVARGIYSFLPLGWRSVRKIEQIVREEMDRAGAQEILMPGVQPAELWQESGRWDEYGAQLLRLKDRKGSDFVLGPTHEEVITDLVRNNISSYKQLPVNLYQVQTKFRDEPRPRFGLMRGREFIMKDAYSFDVDEERAKESYAIMKAAYMRIFERLGFEFRAVRADSGNIGGNLSEEFQVLAETGEDLIVSTASGYAANVEKAPLEAVVRERDAGAELHEIAYKKTPKKRTIAEVSEFLERGADEIVKTMLYTLDGAQTIAVLVRGDHEVNEIKLRSYLLGKHVFTDLELAGDDVVVALTSAPVGFAGPINLEVPIYADLSVQPMVNFVVGSNRKDSHTLNVNHGRDFEVAGFADLRQAKSGDICPVNGEPYEEFRGIEVGHIFYLGTKYSDAMGAMLQGEDGSRQSIAMGCYGIGVTRILAAAIEQSHDKDGMILPMAIAPYHVTVLGLSGKNEDVVLEARRIYDALLERGVEVLLDDRDMGAGAKFKDANLIGVPFQVAIGNRGIKDGVAEYQRRGVGEKESVSLDEIVERVLADLREAGVSV